MAKTRREVNFPRLIVEIQAAYEIDDQGLAEMVRAHRATISRIRTGKTADCSYSLGAALVALHDRRPR